MQTLLKILQDLFSEAVQLSFPQIDLNQERIEVTQSTQAKFGAYQCNSAMKLAKELKQAPRAIAEALVYQIEKMPAAKKPFLDALEIAGPGFINIKVKTEYLNDCLNKMLHDERLGISKQQGRLVIDFSGPNIAKEMHVGHLRSTIIGDSIARLFEFLGFDVLRLNHLGDWGTQFGMLIAYLKIHQPAIIAGTETSDLTHLVAWYRASKKQFDEDAAFKKQAQAEVVKLQQGDEETLEVWKKICIISEAAYQNIYELLDIKITDRGESFYNPFLMPLINDLAELGLITISDGAKCIFMEGFKNREGETLPLMIQKSDGGFNYASTDLAALRHRIEIEKADRIIYVHDAGQSTHFAMVFKAAEKAGFLNPQKVRVDHAGFGVVLGPDGKKFKTRSGDTEKLIDLLTAAVEHARKVINEKSPDLTPEEKETIAQVLGIDAIKYADLAGNRHQDYVFSYERMLKLEGNTAAFLLYAYVRIMGIKRRVKVNSADLKNAAIKLEHPSEIALGLHLCRFAETLDLITQDLLPNHLTDYLYQLAEKFNAFFRDCRVEGDAAQNSRLLLCELVAKVMLKGFDILGLKPVAKM